MPAPKADNLEDANRIIAELYGQLEEGLGDLQARQQATIREFEQTVQDLQRQVAWLKRQLFGRKSEQLGLNKGPGLFDHLPDPPAAKGEDEDATVETETIPAHQRRRGKRKPLPEDLPREIHVHDIPDAERQGLRKINEVTSEQLEIEPGRLYVIQHVQHVYAREDECLDGSQPNVITTPKPVEGLPKCLAGPGLLAYIVVSKFADHLPLYRQAKILKRIGRELSRASMGRWIVQLHEMVGPLVAIMKEQLLESHVIQADETPVRQQIEGKGPTRQCYFYSYVGDEDHPFTLYDYQLTRGRDGPADWFTDARGDPVYHGRLQCDGYTGYDDLFDPEKPWDLTRVGCWAHVRRKFFDARLQAPGACHKALAGIKQLYKVEKRVRKLEDPDERRALRQEKSKPIIEGFFRWCEAERATALPKSGLGEAITYALNQQPTLERYLDNGRLEIDNNACERSIRCIALGRKNWLFTGNQRSGEAAATMFSLVASADRHGHDPLAYLTDVFRRLPATPVSEVGQFLPDRWQPPTR